MGLWPMGVGGGGAFQRGARGLQVRNRGFSVDFGWEGSSRRKDVYYVFRKFFALSLF